MSASLTGGAGSIFFVSFSEGKKPPNRKNSAPAPRMTMAATFDSPEVSRGLTFAEAPQYGHSFVFSGTRREHFGQYLRTIGAWHVSQYVAFAEIGDWHSAQLVFISAFADLPNFNLSLIP